MRPAIVLCPSEKVTEGTGGITWAFRLINALSQRGDVEILPIVNAGVSKKPKLRLGTYRGLGAVLLTHPVHLPAISETEFERLGLSCPEEMIELKRLLKGELIEQGVDLVHMMDWSRAGIGLAFLEVAKELDIPIINIANDYQSICIRSFMQYREVEPCTGPESARKCALCFNDARSASLVDQVIRSAAPRVQIKSPRMAVLVALMIGRIAPGSLLYQMASRLEGYIVARQRSIREAIQVCQRIIFGGDEQRQIVMRWLGLPSERSAVLRHVPDTPSAGFQKKADAFRHPLEVAFVGRSWPGWGVRFLLRGWKELEISPDVAQLFVYTSPGFRRSLRGTSADGLLETPGIEIYEGPVFHRLDEIHRDSALHVIASQWQDQGSQPALEAQVRKTPLIVPDRYETRRYVEDGVTGFHYHWRDLESFKQVLAGAISGPSRLELMSQRIPPPDRRWDDYVEDLVSEYRRALSACN